MATPKPIPYHPPPSIGHEIGVMFGFIGAMALAMTLYGVFWSMQTKKNAKKEAERVERLRASGALGGEKGEGDVEYGDRVGADERVERR